MPNQQSPPVQRTRSFMNCGQCRFEHKKCLPRARDWDGQQQKCERCSHLGYPCGPSHRKPKSVPANRDSLPKNSQPIQRQIPIPESLAPNMTDSAASLSGSTDIRSMAESLSCSSNLPIMIAIHELLLSWLFFVEGQSHVPMLDLTNINVASTTIRNMIQWLDHVFTKAISMHTIPTCAGPSDRDLLAWKVAYLEQRHYNLLNMKSSFQARAYVAGRGRRTACIPHDTETRFLACTAKVFHDAASEPGTPLGPPHLCKEDYTNLEIRIKNFLPDIQYFNSGCASPGMNIRLERSITQEPDLFSAFHIACLNQDSKIACQLLEQSSDPFSGMNIIGRSTMHIAAVSQGIQPITKTTAQAPETVMYSNDSQPDLYRSDLACSSDGTRPVFDTRHLNHRLIPSNPARIATNYPAFWYSLCNKNPLLDTAEETVKDLDRMTQTICSMDQSITENLDQYSAMNQASVHNSHAMHGLENSNRSAQLLNNQVSYGCPNSACIMPAPHSGPCQPYNPTYDPD